MDLTDVIGPMGWSQVKVLVGLLFRPLPGAFAWYSMQIALRNIDHWCQPDAVNSNLTSDEWKDCCIPRQDSGKFSNCEQYNVIGWNRTISNTTSVCNSWDYDKNIDFLSIRDEWDLVCSRGSYITFLYMGTTLGNLLVYLPAGNIADRFGRRVVCLVGIVFSGTALLVAGFSNSVGMMIAFRILNGIGFGIYQNAFLCLFLECVGPQYRTWLILSFSGAWGVAGMTCAWVAYLIPNWRTLYLIASVGFYIPLFLYVWWFVPESSRWLLTVRRYDEAEKQIIQQAKDNGITIEDSKSAMEELKKKVEMNKEDTKDQSTFLDLLKDSHIRKITIILFSSFVFTVFVCHGFSISVGHLGGSIYVNIFFNNLMEVAALLPFFALIKWSTRRKGLLIVFFVTGVTFLLTLPIPEDMTWLTVTVAMLGRLCNSTAYNLLYIFASEIFPTNLRVVGVSGGMFAGRIGSIMSAFMDDLGHVFGRSAPLALYGVLSLVTCLIFYFLPETTRHHLPDSIQETKLVTSGKGIVETVQTESNKETS